MLYKMNVHFVSTLGKLIINTFCISDFFQNWSLLGPSKKKDNLGVFLKVIQFPPQIKFSVRIGMKIIENVIKHH